MVGRLVRKDLELHRIMVVLVLLASGIGVGLIAIGTTAPRTIGVSLLAQVFIAMTFYLPLSTVVAERAARTRPFVMSLPVSRVEVAAAKLAVNLLCFVIPWASVWIALGMLPGVDAVLGGPGAMPLAMAGVLLHFMIVLAVATMSESTGVTIAVIIVFLATAGNFPTLVAPRVPVVRDFLGRAVAGEAELAVALVAAALLVVGLVSTVFERERRRLELI